MGSRESSVREVPAVLSREQNLDLQSANGRLGLAVYARNLSSGWNTEKDP